MMKRKIVSINEDKCNGCGLCVPACHEGAIEIQNGKAVLIEDKLCDGLGDCLGECPLGAIEIIERDAAAFDEEAVAARLKELQEKEEIKANPAPPMLGGCPGSRAMSMEKNRNSNDESSLGEIQSELAQWPVQLTLVPVHAPYFKEADLLVAADCVPLAFPEFHRKLLKGKAVAIGCPKLDNGGAYVDKLADIIKGNNLKSLTVAHMEVPCCFGLLQIVKNAVAKSGVDLEINTINVSLEGNIK